MLALSLRILGEDFHFLCLGVVFGERKDVLPKGPVWASKHTTPKYTTSFPKLTTEFTELLSNEGYLLNTLEDHQKSTISPPFSILPSSLTLQQQWGQMAGQW